MDRTQFKLQNDSNISGNAAHLANKEVRKSFTLSFRPSFHRLLKEHGLLAGTNISRLIEDIVEPELLEREEVRKLMDARIREERMKLLASHITLPDELVNAIEKMKGIGGGTVSHKVKALVLEGAKSFSAGIILSNDTATPVAKPTKPKRDMSYLLS